MSLILQPRELKGLDSLRLNPNKNFAGRIHGERTTKKKGISIEFADYRNYAEGDDLRFMDWNVLARLESPVIKTFRDEEDLAVHLLIDSSASMGFGDPSKRSVACQLAAVLGYVGLAGGDTVFAHDLAQLQRAAPLRGLAQYGRLNAWLAARADQSRGSLAKNLVTFAGMGVRPGLAVLISDGLDQELPQTLRRVAATGHEVWLIQTLSREDVAPDIEGDVRLLDSETDSPVELTANGYVLREYHRRLTDHNAAIESVLSRIGGRYHQCSTVDPVSSFVAMALRRQGWAA